MVYPTKDDSTQLKTMVLVSDTAPCSGLQGYVWIDISDPEHPILKVWIISESAWVTVATAP